MSKRKAEGLQICGSRTVPSGRGWLGLSTDGRLPSLAFSHPITQRRLRSQLNGGRPSNHGGKEGTKALVWNAV